LNYITNITQSAGAFFEPSRFVPREFFTPSSVLPTLVVLGAVLAAGATWKYRTAILHYAEQEDRLVLLKFLYKIGMYDIEAKDEKEQTPLHRAAAAGRIDMVKFLVELGANIEAKEEWKCTPLALAIENDHRDVVEVLFAHGADIHKEVFWQTLLYRAVEFGCKNVAIFLLEREDFDLEEKNSIGRTLLHIAAVSGYEDIIELLLENGADIEATDINNNKSLYFAILNGHRNATEALLEGGANIEARIGMMGRTMLHCAAEKGDEDLTELLLERGADIEARDSKEATPLHVAAYFHPENLSLFVQKLKNRFRLREKNIRRRNPVLPPFNLANIETKKFLNQGDINSITVLELCVAKKNSSAVEMLLKEGASLIPNKSGKTPLDIALEHNFDEILEKFKIHTGYLRHTDENRKTPVQDAFEGRKRMAMEFFIEIEGKSPGVLYDSDRKLCIQYAREAGRRDLMGILSPSDHEPASALRPGGDAVAGFVPPVA